MSYSDINRVVLVGRLTRDPELRALPSGVELCSLRLACNGRRKDTDGSYREKPNFFNVSAFGAQAANIGRYTRRGSRVAVDGRLEWSEWEAGGGERRQAVDIVAQRVEFLDGLPDGGEDMGAGHDQDPGEESERPLAAIASGIDDDVAF